MYPTRSPGSPPVVPVDPETIRRLQVQQLGGMIRRNRELAAIEEARRLERIRELVLAHQKNPLADAIFEIIDSPIFQ